MENKYYFLVNSDNLEKALMDLDQYNEFRLQMSTGDFCSHEATFLNEKQYSILREDDSYTDLVGKEF